MKTRKIKLAGIFIISSIFLQSCMADLRTKTIKKEGITQVNTNKGKELLEKAWKNQGYDKLANHNTYSFHGNDTWKGMLGKMGKIWPDMKAEMDFKFQLRTFNGQVTFIDGKQNGDIAGLQNWNYYEISQNDTVFIDKDKKESKRKVFGIAAFQYFTEMIDRIKNAPIISYAGEKEFKGQNYDLVFCTWETEKPHQEHDQYLAWINKKTGLMDFTQYTIRESYIKPPGYKMLGGAVEFSDFKNINGIMIPHEQFIYAIKIKKKHKKNLHKLIVTDFKFDNFDMDELIIDKNLDKGGDFK